MFRGMPWSICWFKCRIGFGKQAKRDFLLSTTRPDKSSKKLTIVNPEHLFEQADKLSSSASGAPRQADLRRAISSAYYGIFHAVMTAAADQFVGVTKRSTSRYGLVYRSVDHAWLRTLCEEVKKPTMAAR